MPEIGYWKYVRFIDDEKQYWGTDDDVVQVFDSTDDRLEFRMGKDIRFEDDAGNLILTIEKATRTLSAFKMTGNLEIEKSGAKLVLDSAGTTNALVEVRQAGSLQGYFGLVGGTDDWGILDSGAVGRFKVDMPTGDIIKVGDIDMGGNLLKNAKLGTNLDFNDYDTSKIGMLECKERTTPATPAAGYGRIYFKTDGRLYYLNDAGTEYGPL